MGSGGRSSRPSYGVVQVNVNAAVSVLPDGAQYGWLYGVGVTPAPVIVPAAVTAGPLQFEFNGGVEGQLSGSGLITQRVNLDDGE